MTIHSRLLRPAVLPAFLATMLATPLPLVAQDTAQSTEVMPASLLRRLGSAVDGYRLDRPVWVVASLQFPHDVEGVFLDPEQARVVAVRAGTNYRAYGPYQAPLDDAQATKGQSYPGTMLYRLGCHKQIDTSCPRDSITTAAAPIDSVQSVTITVQTKDGHSTSATFRPEQLEAAFFTMSAIDKLLIPYYTQLYGVEYAARERAAYLERFLPRSGR